MRKLNFEQKAEKPRDVGGVPGWLLMLIAAAIVTWLAAGLFDQINV